MSHSWRDDGAAKFAQLNKVWAGRVDAESVQIWCDTRDRFASLCSTRASSTPLPVGPRRLDKACIDQHDIERSLASLPVFLSGCEQLLILAGETYASRLWCVMELFVFVRMGGTRDEMHVKLLGETAKLATRLTKFDAGKARCFLDDDRQRLWAVIEASFGTFEPFNALVKGIFAAELQEATRREATQV